MQCSKYSIWGKGLKEYTTLMDKTSILWLGAQCFTNTLSRYSIIFVGVKNVVVLEDGWIEKLGKENSAVEEKPQPLDVTLDNLAYIVYSSGTTGKPKGKRVIRPTTTGKVLSLHSYK